MTIKKSENVKSAKRSSNFSDNNLKYFKNVIKACEKV